MALEITTDRSICTRCGTAYGSVKTGFVVSHAANYKGYGRMSICKKCIEEMFRSYMAQCYDTKKVVRQMCRKLDLYWDEGIYERVEKKTGAAGLMGGYIQVLNTNAYAGMCYDDTLAKEGTLWSFWAGAPRASSVASFQSDGDEETIFSVGDDIEITDDIIEMWGPGYTMSVYKDLEQRRRYWLKKLGVSWSEIDIGKEALIKQICSLEIDINRARSSGQPADKLINTYNTLLGSASLKPDQNKKSEQDDARYTEPLGVWLNRYENERPLPDKYEDSPILKYIFTWMGHLCEMLHIKGNKYTKLYDDMVRRYTVEKPEYDGDEDDQELDVLEALESSDDISAMGGVEKL